MKQNQALYLMKQGKSVFLTGPAGSGKSFILNKFIGEMKRQKKGVAITASTGIAATHINGTTIHSWSGLGIRDELTVKDKSWLTSNSRLLKRYNSTDILIIDEVSMIHGKRLDMVDQACKLMRDNSEPFGGIQLVLTGDLFQLPPVNRGSEVVDFAHLSSSWQKLNPIICYLSEQHRQTGDELLDVLEAMRLNDLRRKHLDYLQSRLNKKPNTQDITRLFAHNVDVDRINDEYLERLPGEVHTFSAEATGRRQAIEQLEKSLLAPSVLDLKLQTQVMFVANNFSESYANGTRGKVVDFDEDGWPIVELLKNKKRITVTPFTWSREEDGKIRASITQIPLRLAWAITIHKSQGMSLDSALIDLGQTFAYGMGYVALSRIRSLEGLYLSGLNAMALKLHPEIFSYDSWLKSESQKIVNTIGEISEVKTNDNGLDIPANKNVLKKLKEWRLKRAAKDKKPAYIIAHDKTLEDIALRLPTTKQQLIAIIGLGPKKIDEYGTDILKITKKAKKLNQQKTA